MTKKRRVKKRKAARLFRVYFEVPAYAYINVKAANNAHARRVAEGMMEDAADEGNDCLLQDWEPDYDAEPRFAYSFKAFP